MEKSDAVAALAALAQDNRLDVFRLLVQAGPEGMPAGQVASALDLAPNTLTFHFDRLRAAGLVTVRRDGRSMIYAARFETMNALLGYLTENCCEGAPEACAPQRAASRRARSASASRVSLNRGAAMKRMHVHVAVEDIPQRDRLLLGAVRRAAGGGQARLRQVDARRSAREFRDLDARARSRGSIISAFRSKARTS